LATNQSSSFVMPIRINKLNPNGGVILDMQIKIITKIPNHKVSNPYRWIIGNTIGQVITIIEMPSIKHPKITYIKTRISIIENGDKLSAEI